MMRAAGIQDLTKLLSQQPSLLYVSPHSMQEKISFLTDVMGRDVAEVTQLAPCPCPCARTSC